MARSDGIKQNDSIKQAKPAAKRTGADNTQQQRAITDEAKLRSDGEGMAPRPAQGTDDIAAPGALPKSKPSDN